MIQTICHTMLNGWMTLHSQNFNGKHKFGIIDYRLLSIMDLHFIIYKNWYFPYLPNLPKVKSDF